MTFIQMRRWYNIFTMAIYLQYILFTIYLYGLSNYAIFRTSNDTITQMIMTLIWRLVFSDFDYMINTSR